MSFEEYLAGHRRQVEQEERELLQRKKSARLKAAEIAHSLYKQFKVKKVFLFGSLAGGNFFERSDIDLAVTGLAEERYLAAYGIAEAIAVPFAVDLVLLETASISLQNRVLEEGVVIFDCCREKKDPS